jgi:hypothetical protein
VLETWVLRAGSPARLRPEKKKRERMEGERVFMKFPRRQIGQVGQEIPGGEISFSKA